MIKPTKSFWLSWTFATMIGFALGFILGRIAAPFFVGPDLGSASDGPYTLVFLIINVVLISLSQWIVLRTKLVRAWRWIPATAFGIGIGLIFSTLFTSMLEPFLGEQLEWIEFVLPLSIAGAIAGTIIGVLQWFAVAGDVKRSFQWIFVSAISWGIGMTSLAFVVGFMTNIGIDSGYLNSLLGGIVFGGLVGVISGAFVESLFIETTRGSIDPPIPAS